MKMLSPPSGSDSFRSNSSRSEQLRRLDEACAGYVDELPPPDQNWRADVRLVVEHLHGFLLDPDLTIASMREALQLSDHNLAGRFSFDVGCGIAEYIQFHRLALADRLLRLEQLKISEIAYAVGYRNHSAFCMAFQRTRDCTPSEHRKMLREM